MDTSAENTIYFTAVVGADQVIRPPNGVVLPQGPIEVAVTQRDSEPAPPARPGPGVCKGMIAYMAPDFNAPLDDLTEYME